jgi:CDP-paratose 2-epimerase
VRKKKSGESAEKASVIGLVEWFRVGDRQHVEQVLNDMRLLSIHHLRTGISWAGGDSTEAMDWYAWLLPRLAREVEVLPCFSNTPPAEGLEPKISSPPRAPAAFADFVSTMIDRFGHCFEWVELWNDPNSLYDWDWRLDPQWQLFAELISCSAQAVRDMGKRSVLAGKCPTDPNWLQMLFERGALHNIDAIGIHGFPGTWEFDWEDWSAHARKVRQVINQNDSKAELWITKTGFSTWRHGEHLQLRSFLKASAAPIDRMYWYGAWDVHPDVEAQDGFHADERHYHFGLRRADGTPKLLFRIWASGGLKAVKEASELGKPFPLNPREERPVLITGGCGFIGTNLADRLLGTGRPVLIYDNLSRPGVEQNLRWLRLKHGSNLQIEIGDVRDRYSLRHAVSSAQQVFHFAAQVAVTTSLVNPAEDFAINAQGTLNLLEELRSLKHPPGLVFTSTNKVYGALDQQQLRCTGLRYEPIDEETRARGINEDHSLDLRSPYGCSKGVGDQYVIDYSRVFGLPALVFRMSCIYGPHQFGNEDQGWIAYFLLRALQHKPITLYGDGCQVRDVLYVNDLVNALLIAQANMDRLSGSAFNMGGGPANSISLLELIDLVEDIHGSRPLLQFAPWRTGDQRYYVTNYCNFQKATGWRPQVSVQDGVRSLYEWLAENRISTEKAFTKAHDYEVSTSQSALGV